MKKIELEVYKISEKRPKDGQECWVNSEHKGYPTMQVFNDTYNCWDTEDGDDFDFEINDNDEWVALKNIYAD